MHWSASRVEDCLLAKENTGPKGSGMTSQGYVGRLPLPAQGLHLPWPPEMSCRPRKMPPDSSVSCRRRPSLVYISPTLKFYQEWHLFSSWRCGAPGSWCYCA